MREDRFISSAAGRLVRIKGSVAFVPAVLPPTISYTPQLVRLLSDAESELGRLEGLGRMLPDPNILIQPFLRREAVLSSKIEGTHVSFSELLLFEAATKINDRRDHSAQEVANYVLALDYALRQCRQQNPINRQLICAMHERLMGNVTKGRRGSGGFRTEQVHIGRGGAISSARYVPPPARFLDELFANFEDFIELETDIPLLIKLAIIHYQFEAIHPFVDGNGRIGRLLISLMLCSEGRLTYPLLYLSAFFERFQDEYYESLLNVSQRNDWNNWIQFFLLAVKNEARDALTRTDSLFTLRDKYKDLFAGTRGSSAPLTLIEKLIESPVLTIPAAQQILGVSYPSAKQVVNKLVERQILMQSDFKARATYFIADEIISMIEQPQGSDDATVAAEIAMLKAS